MENVIPFLTFEKDGEKAINFYVSLFKNSKINSLTRYETDGPLPKGALMHASFELNGQEFMAMDGGPHFQFSEAFSFFVPCETQDEIDRLWNALAEGGEEQMCGWLKDRFGVSWQIVPPILGQLLSDPDPARAGRVAEAMFKMKKIDIAELQRAYDQKQTEPQ